MRTNAISFHSYPLEQAYTQIKEAGYDSVEVYTSHVSRMDSPHTRRSLTQYAKSLGLDLYGITFDGAKFHPFGTDKEKESAVRLLHHDIDLAADLDAKAVIAWEGIRPFHMGNAVLLDHAVEVFSEAVRYAEQKNIQLLVEPHPFTFGMDVDLLIAFIDRVDSPQLGVLYDSCHFGVGRPYDYVSVIKKLGSRIHHIHFGDSDGKTSELHLPPGEGVLDLEQLVRQFAEIQYSGTLTLDLYLYSFPAHGARRSLDYMKRVEETLGLQ